MSLSQQKIVSLYVILRNKEGRAVVIRMGIPLVIFTNGLFCACILTRQLPVQS